MSWLWTLVPVGVVIVLGLIVGITAISVYKLPKAQLKRCSAEDEQVQRGFGEQAIGEQWLAEHGFHWQGAYEFTSVLGKIVIRAWQQGQSATYLCQYLTAQDTTAIDVVSIFSTNPAVGLTTGSTPDTHFLPDRPGIFKQSFGDLNADQMWRHHTEGEVLVAQITGVDPEPVDLSLDELLSRAIREQMAHVRTLPLWPLRAPYWFLVKRYRLHGLPLAELIDRGLVETPEPALLAGRSGE